MKKILYLAMSLSLFMLSCSHHTYRVPSDDEAYRTTKAAIGNSDSSETQEIKPTQVKLPVRTGDPNSLSMLPNATAFRMSGNYANNVAVTLNHEGELLYFPAPTDITADSEPISLGNGWWLNNQGLAPNSVFTKYTFAEYASLPEVPSPEQIKLNIIPGAKVTDFIELPMKVGEAQNNIDEVKAYLSSQK